MPELPEVEITRRRIEPLLVGRTVSSVRTTPPSYFFLTPPATLKRRLKGRSFVSLERHGKYLLAGLDDEQRLLLHLGMTGQLFAEGASSGRANEAGTRRSAGYRGTHLLSLARTNKAFSSRGSTMQYTRSVMKWNNIRNAAR